jgi:hypothetical protein
MRSFGLAALLLFWTMAIAGCVAQTTPPVIPISPTVTPELVVTPEPTPTSTVVPRTAATVIAANGEKEWDWVVIGDSTVGGLIYRMPKFLEEDLGVKIRPHVTSKDGWSSEGMLRALRTDEKLRQNLRDAEVITFIVPRFVLKVPAETYLFSPPGSCGGSDNQDCLRTAEKQFVADVDAIFAEIVLLRSPSDALIRVMDAHTYWSVAESKQKGTFEGLNGYWRAANDYMAKVAAEYAIPVVKVNEAFNGPNGDEDPRDNGYVIADALHPSEKGADLIAKLIRDLGYEYAPAKP